MRKKRTGHLVKTNPNKANLHFTAENAGYAEKKDICVSDCSIKKYALCPISPRSLRTRRLMKNKANLKTGDRSLSAISVAGLNLLFLFFHPYQRMNRNQHVIEKYCIAIVQADASLRVSLADLFRVFCAVDRKAISAFGIALKSIQRYPP